MTMVNHWKELMLDAVCSRITDGAHSSPPSMPEGMPMASVKDLTPFGIRLESCRRIPDEDYEKLVRQGCQPVKGDVLIAKDGATALDTVCEVKQNDNVVLLSSVAILRPNPGIIDSSYLHYYLDASTTRSYLKSSFISGAAIPRVVLKDLKRAVVRVPPLPVQRRIAGIVSAYDELMENSQRRIRLLEAMASAVYCEWFVHFRFPGHEKLSRIASPLGDIPQGWEVGRLDDVLVLQRGFDLPKAVRVHGTVPIYAATGVTGCHNEAKAKAPGVVTGRSGTIGDVIYVQEDFWPLNTALWAKEFPKAEPLYAYFVLSALDLKQFNSGAAVPTLNRNDIHGFVTLIPPRPLQKRFQNIAGALFAQARALELQIENLRRTRDLLLPRLLSGQVKLETSSA